MGPRSFRAGVLPFLTQGSTELYIYGFEAKNQGYTIASHHWALYTVDKILDSAEAALPQLHRRTSNLREDALDLTEAFLRCFLDGTDDARLSIFSRKRIEPEKIKVLRGNTFFERMVEETYGDIYTNIDNAERHLQVLGARHFPVCLMARLLPMLPSARPSVQHPKQDA